MSKILVGDLRNALSLNESPQNVEIEYNGLEILVKQYLSIQKKINLVSSVYYSSIDIEDELQIVNYNSIEIAFRRLVVEEYTNLTLPKGVSETYDLLTSSGLYDTIYQTIPKTEREDLKTILENYIKGQQDRYERENTVETIVKEGIRSLVGLMENIGDTIGSINGIEDLPSELTGVFASIMENFNELDKDKQRYISNLVEATKGDVGDGEGN